MLTTKGTLTRESGAPNSAPLDLPRCRERHVIGEPCPSCWRVRGEDAGGGRPARAFREPSRIEALTLAVGAAVEEMRLMRGSLSWLAEMMALGLLLAGRERDDAVTRARAHATDLAMRLTDAMRMETVALRVAETFADRAVVAEDRLERARAALPALRVAGAEGGRRAIAEALAKVEQALEGEV